MTRDKLTKLLEFLKMEAESQERINMALQEFSLSSEVEKSKKCRGGPGTSTSKEVAAPALFLQHKNVNRYRVFFVSLLMRVKFV